MQTIEYTTFDKSTWGEGPWQKEPDKVQWLDKDTNFPCLAVRTRMGNWCGYVGVTSTHPLFEKGYDDVNVNVHGGLTFADHCLEGDKETSVCHVVDNGEDDNVWWFGFDCAHCFDYVPGVRSLLGAMQSKESHSLLGEEYRTLEYVQQEVANLAKQLDSADCRNV